jgi:hypothetical protein
VPLTDYRPADPNDLRKFPKLSPDSFTKRDQTFTERVETPSPGPGQVRRRGIRRRGQWSMSAAVRVGRSCPERTSDHQLEVVEHVFLPAMIDRIGPPFCDESALCNPSDSAASAGWRPSMTRLCDSSTGSILVSDGRQGPSLTHPVPAATGADHRGPVIVGSPRWGAVPKASTASSGDRAAPSGGLPTGGSVHRRCRPGRPLVAPTRTALAASAVAVPARIIGLKSDKSPPDKWAASAVGRCQQVHGESHPPGIMGP